MKEFDFDEIDRAVNSQLTSDNSVAPVDDESTAPQSPDVQPEPVAQPLATRRSSGRFMDVVHPSSDMRTKSVPDRPTSREGLSIVPSRNVPSAPAAPYQPPQPVTSDWPDPLDFNSPTPYQAPQSPTEPPKDLKTADEVDEDTDINQIADDINKTFRQDQTAIAPLESPFLADAKVDKRPLGAFSGEASPSVGPLPTFNQLAEPESITSTVEDNSSQDDNPVAGDETLPAELQDDLLLIESGVEATDQTNPAKLNPPVDRQPTPSSGPTSITQQYTEQPPTADKPTVAIFDTEAYHKPLSHPAKKKSGWWLVLWIALLLVVGAGAGAAVFFFVLPK